MPDWPRCFGVWLPEMDLRVGFEWTHRLVRIDLAALRAGRRAGARDARLRAAARRPIALAFALLALQIVLGGLTVLLGLAPWTVTAHLVTGTSFAATLCWIALALRDAAAPHRAPPCHPARGAAVWVAAALVLAQITLGGLVSSNYAGLDCPSGRPAAMACGSRASRAAWACISCTAPTRISWSSRSAWRCG